MKCFFFKETQKAILLDKIKMYIIFLLKKMWKLSKVPIWVYDEGQKQPSHKRFQQDETYLWEEKHTPPQYQW